MSEDLKRAIHCITPLECEKCDYRINCLKIRAKLRKGYVMDFKGQWHKATKEEIKFYEKNFGEEWCSKYLNVKGEKA